MEHKIFVSFLVDKLSTEITFYRLNAVKYQLISIYKVVVINSYCICSVIHKNMLESCSFMLDCR